MSRLVFYQWTQAEVISSRSGQGADGAVSERGAGADAFGLVQPDRGLGEGVVVGVAHAADGVRPSRNNVCPKRTVVYCPGSRGRRNTAQRAALPAPVGDGLADHRLDEVGVLARRALPAGDQPGVGVDDECGVAEPAAGQWHVGVMRSCA
jgi:hypothetical protein